MKHMSQYLLTVLAWAGTLALTPVVAPASAQEKSATTPAADGAKNFSMGSIMGGGDMNTTFDGSYEVELDKDNKPTRLRISKAVHIRSDKLNLDCDLLIYDASANHLVATGEIDKPVHLKQEAVTATCQKLEIYPDDGKSVLTGKPVVKQIGPGGNVMETRGSKITIIQQDGKTRVLVDAEKGGGGSFSSTGNPPSSGGGQPAEITVPLSTVSGPSAMPKPKATPAPSSKSPAAPTLLNPKPAATGGRKAPAVSQ